MKFQNAHLFKVPNSIKYDRCLLENNKTVPKRSNHISQNTTIFWKEIKEKRGQKQEKTETPNDNFKILVFVVSKQ